MIIIIIVIIIIITIIQQQPKVYSLARLRLNMGSLPLGEGGAPIGSTRDSQPRGGRGTASLWERGSIIMILSSSSSSSMFTITITITIIIISSSSSSSGGGGGGGGDDSEVAARPAPQAAGPGEPLGSSTRP